MEFSKVFEIRSIHIFNTMQLNFILFSQECFVTINNDRITFTYNVKKHNFHITHVKTDI